MQYKMSPVRCSCFIGGVGFLVWFVEYGLVCVSRTKTMCARKSALIDSYRQHLSNDTLSVSVPMSTKSTVAFEKNSGLKRSWSLGLLNTLKDGTTSPTVPTERTASSTSQSERKKFDSFVLQIIPEMFHLFTDSFELFSVLPSIFDILYCSVLYPQHFVQGQELQIKRTTECVAVQQYGWPLSTNYPLPVGSIYFVSVW